MRDTARALIGVLIAVCCSQDMAAAAEAGSRWWPFGRREEPSVAQPPGVAMPNSAPSSPWPNNATAGSGMSTDASPERRWMVESPFNKMSWPRVHMPEVSLPKASLPQVSVLPDESEAEAARNAWVEKSPEPEKPSPLEAVTDGAKRVGDSTRTAWHKTVDALTPGDGSKSSSLITRREVRPPFWKRMFGADEAELQGPQTVPEWMAQQRLDP